MKRTTILLLICGVLLSLLAGVIFFRLQAKTFMPAPLSMTPRAQAERVAAHLLNYKITELRSKAIFVQHREEGQALLRWGLKEEKGDAEIEISVEEMEEGGKNNPSLSPES